VSNQHEAVPTPDMLPESGTVQMPRPTIGPLALALGLVLTAAGVSLGPAFTVVGTFILLAGLGMWVNELLPGRGHCDEPLVAPSQRVLPVIAELKAVEHIRPGMPGYRARLPESVHPVSAGVKGGVLGGLVMPAPALLYGILSGHGIWYPVNLLAGMLLPGVGAMNTAQLEQLSRPLLLTAIVIHAMFAVIFGLIYGVLLPMLPAIPRLALPASLAWGGIIFPLLWTAASYGLMGIVNPVLQARVDWPWFIVSQFVFGAVAAFVVDRSEKIPVPPAGQGVN